jgi:hypothetical protein
LFATPRFRFCDPFTDVFDHACAHGNRLRRVHSATVNGRLIGANPRRFRCPHAAR